MSLTLDRPAYRASTDAGNIRDHFIATKRKWLDAYLHRLAIEWHGPASEDFIARERRINEEALLAAEAQPDAWWERRAHLDPIRDQWTKPLPGDEQLECEQCRAELTGNRPAVLKARGLPMVCAECDPNTLLTPGERSRRLATGEVCALFEEAA